MPFQSRSRTDLRVVLHSKDSGQAQRTALATAIQMVMPMVAARLLVDEIEAVSEVSLSSGLLGDFLEADGAADVDTERRMRAAQDLLNLHQTALASFRVATGVGSVQQGPLGLSVTLGEARDAARLASDRERSGWFVHIDRLGLGQLLLSWTTGDTLTRAADSLLAPLNEVERETLAVYLDEESSIVATGKRLGLHRNTVTARVHRIQATLRADLSDPETRLALHVAARASTRALPAPGKFREQPLNG